jgi:hypothetical protein
MPEQLIFDRAEGCQILLTPGDCSIHPEKNELILSNMFSTEFIGG